VLRTHNFTCAGNLEASRGPRVGLHLWHRKLAPVLNSPD
jgi:hypothetical protein